ncbi:hypothetical protein ABZ565_31965 [Streptomyces sp. NPDC016469]|uniref:hypothetical protein n=1 Tax=Streptomyces sp. NPDC016469 TaxID=3157191 RepID=UPI0034053FE4
MSTEQRPIRRADALFIVGKGPHKASLTGLRHRMIEEHAQGPYRVVEVEDPSRDRRPMDRPDYTAAVHDWCERRGDLRDGDARGDDGRRDGAGCFP